MQSKNIYTNFSVHSYTSIKIYHLQAVTLDFRMAFYSLKQPNETTYTERNHVMQVTWQSEYNSAKSELSPSWRTSAVWNMHETVVGGWSRFPGSDLLAISICAIKGF